MFQIDKHTRHKLYWIDYSDPVKSHVDKILTKNNFHVINLGFEFATFIKDKDEAQVRVMAREYLSEVMEKETNVDNSSGLHFAIIKNIGIILEPFLDIDVEKFLKEFSKNMGLIMLWEGSVINNQHFKWPNSENYSLNFKDTNIHKIEI